MWPKATVHRSEDTEGYTALKFRKRFSPTPFPENRGPGGSGRIRIPVTGQALPAGTGKALQLQLHPRVGTRGDPGHPRIGASTGNMYNYTPDQMYISMKNEDRDVPMRLAVNSCCL